MKTLWKLLQLLICLLPSMSNAETSVIYVETGTNLTLSPNIDGMPEDVLWTFNGNKASEHDLSSVYEYGQFTGRTHIDISTGRITVHNMTHSDSGVYRSHVQIRGRMTDSETDVRVMDGVQEPTVTCDPHTETLLCSVSSPSQVSYEWTGPRLIRRSGPELEIRLKESPGSVYTCTVRNDVSQRNRSFTADDCRTDQTDEVRSGQDVLLPVILAFAGIVIVAGIIAALICFVQRRRNDGERRRDHTPEGELEMSPLGAEKEDKNKEEESESDEESQEDDRKNDEEGCVQESVVEETGERDENENAKPSDKNQEAEKINDEENREKERNEDVNGAVETLSVNEGEPDTSSGDDVHDCSEGDDSGE